MAAVYISEPKGSDERCGLYKAVYHKEKRKTFFGASKDIVVVINAGKT